MKAYIKSIPRKAWWLIWCSVVYSVITFGYLAYEIYTGMFFGPESKFTDYLTIYQMVWVGILALPLLYAPLGRWVFKRGK